MPITTITRDNMTSTKTTTLSYQSTVPYYYTTANRCGLEIWEQQLATVNHLVLHHKKEIVSEK
jgi:hypothetical protein